MVEKEKNKQENKQDALSFREWLCFFFLPINMKSRKLFISDLIKDREVEKFKQKGFYKKIEQSDQARFLGITFYIVLFILVINLLK